MVCSVDSVQRYGTEIRRHKAVISIDKHYTDVVLPDFDLQRSTLKVNMFD